MVLAIRDAQLELSSLSSANADLWEMAHQLQMVPALAGAEPAVSALLARQQELQLRLGFAHSPEAAWAQQVPPPPQAVAAPQPPPPMADTADGTVLPALPAANVGDRSAALGKWRRWLGHLERRVATRRLRAAVHGWRLVTVRKLARSQAIVQVVEQQRARSDAAAKSESLFRWRLAEGQGVVERRVRGVARLESRARARLAGLVLQGWRRVASGASERRQLAMAQAMHIAAEEAGAVERGLRLAAEETVERTEHELVAVREQVERSQQSLAVQLAPERERSVVLEERVRLLESAVEAGKDREAQAAKLLREVLAQRQDALLEKGAAVARAASMQEAAAGLGAELAAAKRSLVGLTQTLAACERNGLVRRTAKGTIEVCEIPVSSVPEGGT